MYCKVCGTQLPSQAKACPNCGTLTPAYYANSGASAHDPTVPAASGSSPHALSAPPPSTHYGSNPYETSSQNPYEANPYTVPPPPPPRPPRVSPVLLGILILLIVLIVGASVGFVLLRNNQTRITTIPPTATANPVSPTANADANASATATAFNGLYDTDTSRLPTKDDPLSDNTKGFDWDQGQSCTFTGGAYHASNVLSSGFQVCLAHTSDFSDFLYQVQMTIVKGSYGGLIFRSDAALSNFYIFREGQNGVFTFAMYKNRQDIEIKLSPVLAFKQGPNQTNLLALIAHGSHLIFYINAQYVYDTYDTSFTSGEIGLVAGSLGAPTEVVYSNLKTWTV